MKDVTHIYAQRADDGTVWEEPNGSCLMTGGEYTGNTIAVVQRGADISFDFSGCGEVGIPSLRSFFCKVGVPMNRDRPALGVMVLVPAAPPNPTTYLN